MGIFAYLRLTLGWGALQFSSFENQSLYWATDTPMMTYLDSIKSIASGFSSLGYSQASDQKSWTICNAAGVTLGRLGLAETNGVMRRSDHAVMTCLIVAMALKHSASLVVTTEDGSPLRYATIPPEVLIRRHVDLLPDVAERCLLSVGLWIRLSVRDNCVIHKICI